MGVQYPFRRAIVPTSTLTLKGGKSYTPLLPTGPKSASQHPLDLPTSKSHSSLSEWITTRMAILWTLNFSTPQVMFLRQWISTTLRLPLLKGTVAVTTKISSSFPMLPTSFMVFPLSPSTASQIALFFLLWSTWTKTAIGWYLPQIPSKL